MITISTFTFLGGHKDLGFPARLWTLDTSVIEHPASLPPVLRGTVQGGKNLLKVRVVLIYVRRLW
jgi:hypothetical protein